MEGKVPTESSRPWGEPMARMDGVSVWLRTPEDAGIDPAAGAVFVHGAAVSDGADVRAVELVSASESRPTMARGMPSPGLAAEHGPAAERAIFWGVAPPGADVAVAVTLADGRRVRIPIARESGPSYSSIIAGEQPHGRIAICMATHEPPAELFERQIESIAAQSERNWVCLISDDASSDGASKRIGRATAGDGRFIVLPSPFRLGAYANFGRALEMVSMFGEAVSFVALADQDDVWHRDKLARVADALASSDARLAYSDMRVVEAGGAVLSDTYWTTRQPNHENFASLLLGNSVTGAASMFHRDLLDDALPLPSRFGNLYHDHWLALVAVATGGIEYVDRPLYDYVQHADAVIGHAGANRGVVGGSFARRLAALRGRPPGRLRGEWRRIYFGEYCRMALTAVALQHRLGDRLDPAHRRTLERALALDHSPTALAWLTGRQVRRLRRDDTGGSEAGMLRGLLWRRALGRRGGGDPLDDGDLPEEFFSADA